MIIIMLNSLIIGKIHIIPNINDNITQPHVALTSNLIDFFNATRAFSYCEDQLEFGYRIPGTQAHNNCLNWMETFLFQYGTPQKHSFIYAGINCTNLILRVNPGHDKIVGFGAHWDSRLKADYDPNPNLQNQPVPGANDGASGVAVLFEMIQIISTQSIDWDTEFWFFFFDAEDQGGLKINGENWEYIIGSTLLVQDMVNNPLVYFQQGQTLQNMQAFFLLDMVGGTNLQFIFEGYSNSTLRNAVFEVGRSLGYTDAFPTSGASYSITDDHRPFVYQNIPALDLIIKFWDRSSSSRWPYHHTTGDTLDHLDVQSLNITGRTLLQFMYNTYRSSSSSLNSNSSKSPTSTNSFSIVLTGIERAIIGSALIFLCGMMCIIGRSKQQQSKLNPESENEIELIDTEKSNRNLENQAQYALSEGDQRILDDFKKEIEEEEKKY
jgi:hypothetical protein